MKEFKGTTDWEIVTKIGSDRAILKSKTQKDDVDVWGFRDKNKMLANAKLFKAAPKLLEALQGMVRMYEEVLPAGGWQGQYDDAVSAISKALD